MRENHIYPNAPERKITTVPQMNCPERKNHIWPQAVSGRGRPRIHQQNRDTVWSRQR